jgi:hypothetical protein
MSIDCFFPLSRWERSEGAKTKVLVAVRNDNNRLRAAWALSPTLSQRKREMQREI